MLFTMRIAVMSLGTASALFAAVFLLMSRKEETEKSGLKVFVLEDLFSAGELLRLKVQKTGFLPQRSSRNTEKQLRELYNPLQAKAVSAAAQAAPYTYVLVFTPVLLFMYAAGESTELFAAGAGFLVFLCFYFRLWLNEKLKKRHAEFLACYPSMLTEMSLMLSVGITALDALRKVAQLGKGALYEELRTVCGNIDSGMPAEDALDLFAERCPVKEIKKFVSLFKQNLVKGGPDFAFLLSDMSASAWSERRNQARRLGEAAEQKLLLPTLFMFLGIVIIVIVPAFNNLF